MTIDTLPVITQAEYDKLPTDYKGVWKTERDDMPGWAEDRHLYMGKRTMLKCEGGATWLAVEGISFIIKG